MEITLDIEYVYCIEPISEETETPSTTGNTILVEYINDCITD